MKARCRKCGLFLGKKEHICFPTKVYTMRGREILRDKMLGEKNPARRVDVRNKISKSLSGRKQSKETIEKIRDKMRGNTFGFKKNQSSWNKGIAWNEETRRKMSKSKKGINPSSNKALLEWMKKNGSPQKGRKYPLDKYPNFGVRKIRKTLILPKKDTRIEVKIQNFLKQLNIDFFTHQYIKEIEHGYQCDILVPSMSLIIECDGDYWHKYPIGNEIDHIRTKELIEKGFRVLRLWEKEIKIMNINKFKERLYA